MNTPLPAAAAPERTASVVAWTVAIAAFGVVLATLPSAVFDLERYTVPKTLVLHATALVVLAMGAVHWRAAARRPLGGALVLAVGLGGVSAALAENRWLALGAWGVTFSGVTVFLAVRTLDRDRRAFVVAAALAAAVLAAALGIAQAYGASWWFLSESRPPGATFGNRNFLAHVSAIAAPGLLVGAVRARSRPAAALLPLVGLAVVVMLVVLTRSRAAWLGGAIGLGATLLALVPSRTGSGVLSRRAGLAAVLVALAVAMAVLLPNALRWTTDAPYAGTLSRLAEFREGSGRGRLIQYRTSLRLAAESPLLGVGPGNWFVHYPRVTEPGDPSYAGHLAVPTNPWPSSDWVAVVVERGVPGALLLLTGGVLLFATGLGRALSGGGRQGAEGAALVGVLTATLVTGAFDAVLLLPAPALLVAALAGGLSGGADAREGGVREGWGMRAVGVGVAALLVAFAGGQWRAVAITAGGRDAATLERAVRWAPGEHRLRLLLAGRGRCEHARRAAELLPHHPPVEGAERCG